MTKKRTSPFLGAFKLFWCDTCNLPILDQSTCSICSKKTRKVKIAPPGDVRPAFPADVDRIADIIDEKFGPKSAFTLGLTCNRIVLLNEVSYRDLMDEIIIDGQVVGAVRFDIFRRKWDFVPRMIGAQRIFADINLPRKRYLMVDEGAVPYIAKGYNILAPGVTFIDPSLEKSESSVVLSPEKKVLATGIMSIDAGSFPNMKKGMVLKPKSSLRKMRKVFSPNINAPNQTWSQVVQANQKTLQKYEQQALAAITNIQKRFPDLPVSVSFSGGKDSLVCLQLTRKLEDTPFHIIFVNTGIEFPETIDYIEQFIVKNNYQDVFCRKDIPSETFWKNVEKYGPPGKDYRYCCKILKIGPINELIDDCIGQKTLSIIGQRAYESISRSESNTLWTNPWIPNQLNFTPIQHWTALHVWLYIFQEKLFYNPLYEQGFSRIGCWLCPACNQGTFELIKEANSELWSPWEDFLENWRKEYNLPKEWLQWGLWRWRDLPKKIIDLAAEKGVALDFKQLAKKKGQWDLSFTLFEGFATCKTGDLIIEGTFNTALNLLRLQQFWEIFSTTDYDANLGILKAELPQAIIVTLSADGALTASGKEKIPLLKALKKLVLEVFRSEECTACKVCLSHCPKEALFLDEGLGRVVIDDEKCIACGKCHTSCPVIKFGHSEIDELFSLENF